jgi:hypothetical protein
MKKRKRARRRNPIGDLVQYWPYAIGAAVVGGGIYLVASQPKVAPVITGGVPAGIAPDIWAQLTPQQQQTLSSPQFTPQQRGAAATTFLFVNAQGGGGGAPAPPSGGSSSISDAAGAAASSATSGNLLQNINLNPFGGQFHL